MARRTTIKGGKRLKRFLANAKRSARARQPVMTAGFHEPHVAALAAQLEFGNPRTNLPEWPAFRQTKDAALAAGRAVVVKELKGRVRSGDVTIPATVAEQAAEAMAKTLRFGYADYHGPGLSERQRARKEGTPHEDDELVGHRGPRLIQHIRGRVER